MAYPIVLWLHSILRWIVVVLGILVVVRAFSGWFLRKPWANIDDRLGLSFVVSLDLQLLLGLVLYFFLSPHTRAALQDMGGAMGNANLRFFAVEHLVLMLVGLILAHIGRARSRRAADPVARHRTAAIFYTLAILLILVGIPWPFSPVGRPLFP